MDVLTKEQRHKNMSAIKSKGSKIEVTLRKALWKENIRYRKNLKSLPGTPDIVLTKYKIAIFCDSEYFHGKNWDELQVRIKRGNNPEFWLQKISGNIQHDRDVDKRLREIGWVVLRFWGQDIIKHTDECVRVVKECISMQYNSEGETNGTYFKGSKYIDTQIDNTLQ